ncbi:MAG: hypothetical protein LBU66_01225 [Treponema sp.]|jgi:hypothetical protein|nr:hypothetical protein [Treponema sp.]
MVTHILKGGLFIYECVRTILLAFTLTHLLPGTSTWLAFASPAAILPLMALFILIDTSRFRNYIPLFIAGKVIGVFSLLVLTLIKHGDKLEFTSFIELVFLSGDLFALAAVLLISKKSPKLINETPQMEVKQCE